MEKQDIYPDAHTSLVGDRLPLFWVTPMKVSECYIRGGPETAETPFLVCFHGKMHRAVQPGVLKPDGWRHFTAHPVYPSWLGHGSEEEENLRIGDTFAEKVISTWCCCCSFARSCLTLCDIMYCSTPVFSSLPCTWFQEVKESIWKNSQFLSHFHLQLPYTYKMSVVIFHVNLFDKFLNNISLG